MDGGIIGGPVWQGGNTCLYLSGKQADECSKFFTGGPLQPRLLGEEIGRASAIKMCYAAYTKGTTALLANILALAESHRVRGNLGSRWEEDWPGLPKSAQTRIGRSALKAWRFSGEMKEIAETFAGAGLPDGFHLAAARLYERLADFKGHVEPVELEDIINTLLQDDC